MSEEDTQIPLEFYEKTPITLEIYISDSQDHPKVKVKRIHRYQEIYASKKGLHHYSWYPYFSFTGPPKGASEEDM